MSCLERIPSDHNIRPAQPFTADDRADTRALLRHQAVAHDDTLWCLDPKRIAVCTPSERVYTSWYSCPGRKLSSAQESAGLARITRKYYSS
jgi:hypothetical protein